MTTIPSYALSPAHGYSDMPLYLIIFFAPLYAAYRVVRRFIRQLIKAQE